MHFRGWRAYGASSGPECRMRKTFPAGSVVETSDKCAPEIEALTCSQFEAQGGSTAATWPPQFAVNSLFASLKLMESPSSSCLRAV